jgi:hypothetical protein
MKRKILNRTEKSANRIEKFAEAKKNPLDHHIYRVIEK